MKILFFDTETNGLAKNFKAPPSADDNWPRLLQLGAMMTMESGKEFFENSQYVLPSGFEILPEVSELTGITQSKVESSGFDLKIVLAGFNAFIKTADIVVAHNMLFDYSVMASEFMRAGIEMQEMKHKICTMTDPAVIRHCKIKGKIPRQYKWPTLTELHQKLFKEEFDGAHDALNDVKALKKSFFELQRLNVVSLFIPDVSADES